jgi:hypothetical protein
MDVLVNVPLMMSQEKIDDETAAEHRREQARILTAAVTQSTHGN